jgi:hypothetical protein
MQLGRASPQRSKIITNGAEVVGAKVKIKKFRIDNFHSKMNGGVIF